MNESKSNLQQLLELMIEKLKNRKVTLNYMFSENVSSGLIMRYYDATFKTSLGNIDIRVTAEFYVESPKVDVFIYHWAERNVLKDLSRFSVELENG